MAIETAEDDLHEEAGGLGPAPFASCCCLTPVVGCVVSGGPVRKQQAVKAVNHQL